MLVKEIIIHHSASSKNKTTVDDINNWHKVRWPDFKSSLGYWIGYHFVITGDGKLTQTRRSNELGAHCIPNEGKVGICLTGNFDIEEPNKEQLNSLTALLEQLKKEYNLEDKNIFGHCEKSQTACPGKNLVKWIYLNRQVSILQKLINLLKSFLKS